MNQSEDQNQALETVDELKEEIEKIKVMCIATHIMEITRRLSEEKKKKLEAYCDKVMLDYDETFTNRE